MQHDPDPSELSRPSPGATVLEIRPKTCPGSSTTPGEGICWLTWCARGHLPPYDLMFRFGRPGKPRAARGKLAAGAAATEHGACSGCEPNGAGHWWDGGLRPCPATRENPTLNGFKSLRSLPPSKGRCLTCPLVGEKPQSSQWVAAPVFAPSLPGELDCHTGRHILQ